MAQIDSPDWFAPVNVARLPAAGLEVTGLVDDLHGAGVGSWELEYACGQDALDSAFQPLASGTAAIDHGHLATIPKAR